MATLEIVAEKPPILQDKDGIFRVGGTRDRLETVVTAFDNGCTAEEILYKYPSLSLTDIYAVITYYLQHAAEIETYLADRRLIVDESDRQIESRFPSAGVRERLLSRRTANL